jgi:DNA mismatch repair protein MutS2
MSSELPIYPASAAQKIGLQAILDATIKLAHTPYGEDYLRALKPSTSRSKITFMLQAAAEWMKIEQSGHPIPLESVDDVVDIASDSKVAGSRLPLEDFTTVFDNARLARLLLTFFKRFDSSDDAKTLQGIAKQLVNLRPLEDSIKQIVTEHGELRDDASPELRRIRKRINREKNKLRSTVQKVMKRVAEKGMTSDEGATIRGGRMVIPVQAEFKRKVEGFIHDVSSTGQTVYLEPVEALQINNDIRQLESEEQREIDRIIRELTAEVRKYSDSLITNTNAIGQLDAIQCRVQLGLKIDGSIPELADNFTLELHHAKSPNLLLKNISAREPEPVVPLDVTLEEEDLGLIITGPNAGGKSVAMKTIGLLSMMLQSGYPIPVQPHSRLPVIKGLFVDVGDEQSIENDLSTFSSRLTWMRETLNHSLSESLVLIDEAGSGTDPDEGGALFQAFTEFIIKKGSRVIITTHHGSLKVFAQDHPNVVNGAMEFNQENLSPTYKFKKGVPGSSYAFEIADRLKLQKNLIQYARDLLGENRGRMSDLLVNLEKKMQESEDLVREYRIKSKNLEKKEKQFLEKSANIDDKRSKILEKAYKDAGEIMQDANRRIEQAVEKIISEGRENKETIKEARKEVDEAKKQISQKREAFEDEKEKPFRSKKKPVVGDYVLIGDSNTAGELVDLNGKNATVLVNGMKIKAKTNNLVKTKAPSDKTKKRGARSYTTTGDIDLSVKPSIELRGMRGEEAIKQLTQYIDRAIARGLKRVEIIHGKGEGILLSLIHDYLEKRDDVSDFEIAPIEQGGSGCTIVELK